MKARYFRMLSATANCLAIAALGSLPTLAQGQPASPSPSAWVRKENKERVIVFVHGFLGSPGDTWTCPNPRSPSWPQMLTGDHTFDDSDIYVVGYKTALTGDHKGLTAIVESLKDVFDNEQLFATHKEVVFVCHSLGGLLVQELLVTYHELARQVPFIFFFGTPQKGSSVANVMKLLPGASPLLIALQSEHDPDGLLTQLETFWNAAHFSTKRFCAYETEKTPAPGILGKLLPPALVVDYDSATRHCDEAPRGIGKNHIDMVKPCGYDDEAYHAFKAAAGRVPIARGKLTVYPLSVAFDKIAGQFRVTNDGTADLNWSVEIPPYFSCPACKGSPPLAPNDHHDVDMFQRDAVPMTEIHQQKARVTADHGQFIEVSLNVSQNSIIRKTERDLHKRSTKGESVASRALDFAAHELPTASAPTQKSMAAHLLVNAEAYSDAVVVFNDSGLTASDVTNDPVYRRDRFVAEAKTGNTHAAHILRTNFDSASPDKDLTYAAVALGGSPSTPLPPGDVRQALTMLGLRAHYEPSHVALPDIKTRVGDSLREMATAAAQILHIPATSLRANVFLLDNDGRLQIPDGFAYGMSGAELSLVIPVGTGATGCTFLQGRFTFTDLHSHDLWTRARQQDDWGGCPEWQRALLPASEMSKLNSHLTWIASTPVMTENPGQKRQPAGVLNLDAIGVPGDRTRVQVLEPLMADTARKIAMLVLSDNR